MHKIKLFKTIFLLTVFLLYHANAAAQCDYTDDFITLPTPNATSYTAVNMTSATTLAGWAYTNVCTVQGADEGVTPSTVRTKYQAMQTGEKGVSLNGVSGSAGTITSPVFSNGCKSISFSYAIRNTNQQRKLEISIEQNDEVDTTFLFSETVSIASTKYDYSINDINITGDYQIKIKNTTSTGSGFGSDVVIWNICITANVADAAPPAPAVTIAGQPRDESSFWDKATVTLTGLSGTEVYYTLDGTPPDASTGTLYDGTPFELTATTTLKTIAVNTGSSQASEALDTLITIAAIPYRIIAPSDATVFVGDKNVPVEVEGNYLYTHYVPFAEKKAVYTTDDGDGKKTWYYNIGGDHNYRVSRNGALTHVGTFRPGHSLSGSALEITEAGLISHGPKDIDHNVNNLSGRNVADVFLNINARGHLHLPMRPDTAFQIINTRIWQAINTDTENYFIEPDFHYTIVDESGATPEYPAIAITDSGRLTPLRAGTAIVLVTYDAMNCTHLLGSGYKAPGGFFGAIWPENTGVFVVTVGDAAEGVTSNMTVSEYWNSDGTDKTSGIAIDAEHDVLYYEASTGGYDYTFTPEGIINGGVLLAQPEVGENSLSYSGFSSNGVTRNADGSYTVRLVFGRNIVKLISAGNYASSYQVITAKPVTWTVENVTHPGETFAPGDEFSITFNTLYHPANKMSGIYNMSAGIQYRGFGTNFPLILSPAQYTFASGAQEYKRQIPADYAGDDILLDKGVLKVEGFGSKYGEHRNITYQNGVAPNLNAVVREAYCGSLPDIRLHTVGRPPTVPGNGTLNVLSRTDTTVMLQWTASTDNVGVTGYVVWQDGDSLTTVKTTTYKAENLTAETTYTFEVAAVDASANRSAKATQTVATLAATDPSAPVVAVTGVTLSPETATLAIGATRQLTAAVTPANATDKAVIWESSNPAVAEVNYDGLVTVHSAGAAAIIVTTLDGSFRAFCNITAGAEPPVVINPFELITHSLTLEVEQISQLDITVPEQYSVTWYSLDSAVAKVNASGEVTAMGVGTTKIIAEDAAKGKVDICTVIVNEKPPKYTVRLDHTEFVMNEDDRIDFKVTVSPAFPPSVTSVTWLSSNPEVADVTNGGTVIAVASGKAVITAQLLDTVFATCNITVRDVYAYAETRDVASNEATLTFPRFSAVDYYLVRLFEVSEGERIPEVTYKVNTEGNVVDTVFLRAFSPNIRLTLRDLKSSTQYEADIDVMRTIDGTDEAVSTLSVSFTTQWATGVERPDALNAAVRYSSGALRLRNLKGYACHVTSVTGQSLKVLRVNNDEETFAVSLSPGIYILTAQKEGGRKTFKFVVH
jgi:uncharacterized protein YjdB